MFLFLTVAIVQISNQTMCSSNSVITLPVLAKGDAYRVNPKANPLAEGHVIRAAIFWSPEAMLNLRWGPPTDIWSLGTTVCS